MKGVIRLKASEAIREVMSLQGVGTNKMADRLNKPPRLVSDRLSQDNISVAKMDEMLRVLDYKIVIVPREARVPEGGFEIE